MTLDFATTLDSERKFYYRRAGGGLSLPVAGLVYWLLLAGLGLVLEPRPWIITAFVCSGLIVPLGFALARPLGADLTAKSALSSVFGPAIVSMLLSWGLTLAAFAAAPALVPLCLAIGMGLHWPVIGWMYHRTVAFCAHAVVRTLGGTLLWFALPDARFTLLPLLVAAVYGATIAFIAWDRARPPALSREAV